MMAAFRRNAAHEMQAQVFSALKKLLFYQPD